MAWDPENYKFNPELDKFMKHFWYAGLAFDDVLAVPRNSAVVPDDANVKTWFSRNIPLLVPIVSAAMVDVTNHRLAIALAKKGGLGILHKYFPEDYQAREVERTKYALNVLIKTPITFAPTATIGEILKLKRSQGYNFNSFPIVDSNGKLAGLITGHHIKVTDDLETKVEKVMQRKVVTRTEGMSPEEAYQFMKKEVLTKLPLIDDAGKLAGMYDWDDLHAVMQHKDSINLDSRGQLRVGAAVGIHQYERAEKLVKKHVDVLVVDSAHGDSENVIETVRELKKQFDVDVVAGNVSTREGARNLLNAGADGVKVGQGPGSICSTRIVAGIGVPQITATHDVASAVEGEVPVCTDGGIRYSGDVVKAFVAGASNVMLGGLLAGSEESPGDTETFQGRKFKVYRGMGSEGVMKEFQSQDRYGHLNEDPYQIETPIPQGVEGRVALRGSVDEIVRIIVGGIKSGMGYLGAATIPELSQRATFIFVTAAGQAESHPHDIQMTKESSNYPEV